MKKAKISKLGLKFIVSTLIPALFVLIMVGAVCFVVVSQNKIGSIRQEIVEQSYRNDTNVFENLNSFKDILDFDKGYSVIYSYINNIEQDKEQTFYNNTLGLLNEYVMYNPDNIVSSWLAVFDKGILVTDEINKKGIINVGDFNSIPWYEESALSKGDVYFSEIYETEISDKYSNNKVVSVVCPVLDWKTNELIGAYGIEVTMNYLNSIMTISGYKDAIALIVDPEGGLSYCKNAVLLNKYNELTKAAKSVVFDKSENISYNGRKYYAVDTTFSMTGWRVIYLVNKDEINDNIAAITFPLIITVIVACIVISIILITYIIRFVHKINSVKKNTVGIAEGNYDDKMKVDSDDEFGELAVAFNNTIDFLKRTAEHDGVTNIYNITTFYIKAQELIKNNDPASGRYAIIRLDIDHFRVVNDIYSWQVGDNVLRYIANSLERNINEDSICGRISGDVFVMCVKYSSIMDIEEMLNRIKKDIIEYDIAVNIIPHFGIYLDAEKELPVYLMCDRAGIALSLIKGNMLTTFSYYDTVVNRINMDIKFIETSTQAAFDEHQFFIQLQPKYNMHTNEIVGAEALVRWKHPVKGIIRPDSFIPVFEKNGNILKLDEYVWEETCKCLSRWNKMGYSKIPVSVNISRVHVYNKHLVEKLCMLVKKYDIPVELLQLEFTESALLEDASELYDLMYKLKEKNFVLLMDDFASGYSSLNTLKSAPFDIVKLDKEFISAVTESKRDRMLVASTISMIDMQSMDVVVEGVETEEQVDVLIESGCNIAQGFFFSKPVNVSEFEKIVYDL